MSQRPGPRPAPLEKRLPALMILGIAPGCVHFLISFLRWRAGDHLAWLGDGANFWAAGKLVLSGHLNIVLDPYLPKYDAGGFGFSHWVYPPPMLLVAVPFGLLPMVRGVLLYDALSLALLALCLRAAGFGPMFAAAVMLSPAALESLAGSQNGAMLAALLIAGLFLAERSPWTAGILFGLATVKPQLGLLIPVYLLARGNWRAIAGAALAAACLAAAALAFGPGCWADFFSRAVPFMGSYLIERTAEPGAGPQSLMMTVFSLAREAGAGAPAAYAAQAAATLTAGASAWMAGRRVADEDLRLAILLVSISLASPYLWCYDMIPGSLGVALLIRAGLRRGFFRGEFLLLALLWITPGLALYQAVARLPSFCPPVAIAVLLCAWRHAASSPAR